MDQFFHFDSSHLIGSSPVAGVILYVAIKVVKPLLAEYLENMTKAIRENTETVSKLVETETRASQHNMREHAEIVSHLKVLTDTLLKVNGRHPVETEKPKTTEDRVDAIEKYLKGDF